MKYKYSHYNVFSAEFNEKILVFNTSKDRMLLLSKKVFEKYIAKNIIPTDINLLEKFIKGGVVVDENKDEINSVLLENKQAVIKNKTLSLIIFPTANCQLGCVYCGQVHFPIKLNEKFYTDITKKVTSLIANKKHLNIGWFGGEPLLGIEIIEKLTPVFKKIAEKHNCTYGASATTNALLLNKRNVISLLENNVKDITISIDGTEGFHDERRPTKGGKGSFKVIMKNLKDLFAFVKNNKSSFSELMIRINVDKYNKEGVVPLLKQLKEIGCQGIVSEWDIAPIHSWGNDADKRSLSEKEFADFHMDVMIKLLEMGLIDKISLPNRNKIVCQAVINDSYYIDPFGKVYDCSEYPLIRNSLSYSIGDVSEETTVLNEKRTFNNWYDQLKKYPCYECKLLPVCAGGCPKAWKENYPACPTIHQNIDEYLVLSYLTLTKNISNEII